MDEVTAPLTLAEYERLAAQRLDRSAYDYYAGGAGDEISLADARAAFNRIRLRPRVLVDVSRRDCRPRPSAPRCRARSSAHRRRSMPWRIPTASARPLAERPQPKRC